MWSRKYKKCIECQTTNYKHQSRGLCESCYTKKLYHTSEDFRAIKVRATAKWRAKNRERFLKKLREYYYSHKEKISEHNKKIWQDKYRHDPEFREKKLAYARAYYHKNKAKK